MYRIQLNLVSYFHHNCQRQEVSISLQMLFVNSELHSWTCNCFIFLVIHATTSLQNCSQKC